MPEICAASVTVIHSGPLAGRVSLALATSSGSSEVAATSVASACSGVMAAISSALGKRSHAGAVSGWNLRVAAMEQNDFFRPDLESISSYLAKYQNYVKHIELMTKTADTTTSPACPKGQGSDLCVSAQH